MKKPDGGAAFPRVGQEADGCVRMQEGMSLRDYFATKAMASLIQTEKEFTHEQDTSAPLKLWTDYARAAYQMADAMLAERDK